MKQAGTKTGITGGWFIEVNAGKKKSQPETGLAYTFISSTPIIGRQSDGHDVLFFLDEEIVDFLNIFFG